MTRLYDGSSPTLARLLERVRTASPGGTPEGEHARPARPRPLVSGAGRCVAGGGRIERRGGA